MISLPLALISTISLGYPNPSYDIPRTLTLATTQVLQGQHSSPTINSAISHGLSLSLSSSDEVVDCRASLRLGSFSQSQLSSLFSPLSFLDLRTATKKNLDLCCVCLFLFFNLCLSSPLPSLQFETVNRAVQ